MKMEEDKRKKKFREEMDRVEDGGVEKVRVRKGAWGFYRGSSNFLS